MVSGKESDGDLGFGGAYRPADRVESSAPPVRTSGATRSSSSKKPVAIGVGILFAGLVVFGFMKMVSGAGQQVAQHNNDVLTQVDRTKDVDAQSTAHAALLAAKSIYASDASYAGADAAGLAQTEPSFQYTAGASTGSKVVSVSASAGEVGMAVSAGKTCWYLADSATGGTKYGSGTGPCTGAAALGIATAPSW